MTSDLVRREIDAALAGGGISQLLDRLAENAEANCLDYTELLREAAVQATRRLNCDDAAYVLHEAFNCLARSPVQCH